MAVASPPPPAGRSHPTYKEMVMQALTELRESGGSSRDAISKYIADHFSGLPARHDDFLSVHLRRLRSQGLLLMSGYSYLLPSAVPPRRGRGRPRKIALDQKRGPRKTPDLASGVKRGPGRPRKNTTPVAASGVKRGRGRPPKILTAASESATFAAIATAPVLNIVTSVRRGRGRPPKVLLPAHSSIPSLAAGMRKRGRPRKYTGPESVLSVALTTRGPGRQRKDLKAGVEAQPQAGHVTNGGEVSHLPSSGTLSTEKRGRGRPRKRPLETETTETGVVALVEKRGPGRPRKNTPSAPLSLETEGVTMSGYKRGRGRPRKRPLEIETSETGAAALVEKRWLGRPRKENPSAPLSVETEGVTMIGYKRGRGRPRKRPLESETTETALVEKRGPGRPRKTNPSGSLSLETEGVAMTGYKRGRGRPRKENPSAGTGIIASIVNKRGRGRPRKNVSFRTESAEAAVVVSRDLAESKPKIEDSSVSGNKTETENILSVAGIEVTPTDAGGPLVSGEKASTAHVEAEDAMVGVDPVISNLDMENMSL